MTILPKFAVHVHGFNKNSLFALLPSFNCKAIQHITDKKPAVISSYIIYAREKHSWCCRFSFTLNKQRKLKYNTLENNTNHIYNYNINDIYRNQMMHVLNKKSYQGIIGFFFAQTKHSKGRIKPDKKRFDYIIQKHLNRMYTGYLKH